jgi:CDP-glucose 4,6-dehydratase
MKFKNVFKNKKVLITGHTGFKGSWLSIWLNSLGANVIGVSKDIPTNPSHFKAAQVSKQINHNILDICDASKIRELVLDVKPDFIFHLAAQALVRHSYEKPLETINTNALGTANLLDALRQLENSAVAVMITSDKVYDNVEWVWGYRESDRLGGKDPYSASKGMAELAIRTFIESYFRNPNSHIKIGIARAGNVIGGGDWAKDRIVPDCMEAWSCNRIVKIRNPNATRPWQHVLEPLSGYLTLAMTLLKDNKINGEAYNFGPPAHQNYAVSELIIEMSKHWSHIRWNDILTIQKNQDFNEAGLLKLNCDKALSDLKWLPSLNFDETVKMTVNWYKNFYENPDVSVLNLSRNQINEYAKYAKSKEVLWAME